jgi:purine-binding chemotaxis protein CheW
MSTARSIENTPAATPQRWARVEAQGVREFLAFLLGPEAYALPLSCVREIMRVPMITEVPRAPHEVLGIVSVRGQVTTLLDLRRKLKVAESSISTRTRVLLVDQGDEILGLLCDRVLQVHRLSEEEVEMASVLGREASSYVMGIGRPGQRSRTANQAANQQTAKSEATAGDDQILILLDPIVLLKRQAYG